MEYNKDMSPTARAVRKARRNASRKRHEMKQKDKLERIAERLAAGTVVDALRMQASTADKLPRCNSDDVTGWEEAERVAAVEAAKEWAELEAPRKLAVETDENGVQVIDAEATQLIESLEIESDGTVMEIVEGETMKQLEKEDKAGLLTSETVNWDDIDKSMVDYRVERSRYCIDKSRLLYHYLHFIQLYGRTLTKQGCKMGNSEYLLVFCRKCRKAKKIYPSVRSSMVLDTLDIDGTCPHCTGHMAKVAKRGVPSMGRETITNVDPASRKTLYN